MLEGLAAWVLNTYVGEYVENLNTDQLSIALLQGAVELENLPLKKDALKSLDIPLEVKSGFIGKITLHIPLRRLRSEPWVISIEKLYLVAGPLKNLQYNEAEEKEMLQNVKRAMLEALETKWQVLRQTKAADSGSWFSYGASMAANILENIQLNVKDVHLRYEDDKTNPARPFSCGLTIKKLSVHSTDSTWVPKFVSHDSADIMYKLVDLQNLAVYCDNNVTLLGDLPLSQLADELQREMFRTKNNQFKEHEYILQPINAQARVKRYTSTLPLRSPNKPRITVDLTMDQMAFSMATSQYRSLLLWQREFSRHNRRRKYRKFRPACTVRNNARRWWTFAIQSHLNQIRERNRRLTRSFLTERAHQAVIYSRLYADHLMGEPLTQQQKEDKDEIEEKWEYEELKVIRERIFFKLRRENKLSIEITRKPHPGDLAASAQQPQPQQDTPSSGGGGLFRSWFPGWSGWYQSTPATQSPPSSPHSSSVSPVVDQGGSMADALPSDREEKPVATYEEEAEIEQEILDVINDSSENSSFLRKDTVFARMSFILKTGSFKLVENFIGDTEMTSCPLAELQCTTINMEFESRPRTSAMKFSLAVGSLFLEDLCSKNSVFPYLICPQSKDPLSRSGSNFNPILQTRGGEKLRQPSKEEAADPKWQFFKLVYEKNPANSRFKYNLSYQTLCSPVSSWQFEKLRKQTQEELKHTLDQLLEAENRKGRWHIDLDISAPKLIVPENLLEQNPVLVVMDLGNFRFKTVSAEEDAAAREETEEDFQTPMSTPPNEAESQDTVTGSELSKKDSSHNLNLTDAAVMDRLYEKYKLELTEMQVLMGRLHDNWRHAYARGTSIMHILDRFTISLQLERRLIVTADPRWPTATVSGTLPSLTFHLNERKIQAMRTCVDTLTTSTTSTPTLMSSHSLSSSGVGLSSMQSAVDMNRLHDVGGEVEDAPAGPVDNNLFIVQFLINNLSLEVQSKALLELQVTGVQANLHKKPENASLALTVHSLLVVDALQSYGQDFELLVASHHNVQLDSRSGSIMGSEVNSPVSPQSPCSPSSPRSQSPVGFQPGSFSGLQAIQDALSSAFQYLPRWPGPPKAKVAGLQDEPGEGSRSEALISLEFEIVSPPVSPAEKTGDDTEMRILNLQFNSLDFIANQETLVEILGFLKRTFPSQEASNKMGQKGTLYSASHSSLVDKPSKELTSNLYINADFKRLNVLLLRFLEEEGARVARKVATATMSSAKVQATLDNSWQVEGSLGGLHLLDVVPEGTRYQQVISIGQAQLQPPELNSDTVKPAAAATTSGGSTTTFTLASGGSNTLPQASLSPHCDMFKTAMDERIFSEVFPVKTASRVACRFNISKVCSTTAGGIANGYNAEGSEVDASCDRRDTTEVVEASFDMASLCYIHCPKFLDELVDCVSEFGDYMTSVATSIKTAATEVAMGMVGGRMDKDVAEGMSMTSLRREQSLGDITNTVLLQDLDMTGAHNVTTSPVTGDSPKNPIVLNARMETPILVIPCKPNSPQVLLAHLGEIVVDNTGSRDHHEADAEPDDYHFASLDTSAREVRDKIYISLTNMNLYSVDFDKHKKLGRSLSTSSFTGLTHELGVPILYDTAVDLIIRKHSVDVGAANDSSSVDDIGRDGFPDFGSFAQQSQQQLLTVPSSVLDINIKISSPIKLGLSKEVYEQILQTADNLTYEAEVKDVPMGKRGGAEGDVKMDAARPQNAGEGGGDSMGTRDVINKDNSVGEEKKPLDKRLSEGSSSAGGSKVDAESFMAKHIQFQVPLFEVELRGDFGEGEQGLVDLQLYDFAMDFKKNDRAATHMKLRLKSLHMDDLLEAPTSSHRQIMVSRNSWREKKRDRPRGGAGRFMSTSCPDCTIVVPVPQMPPSLPSSFHESQSPPALHKVGRSPLKRTENSAGRYPNTPPPTPQLLEQIGKQEQHVDDLVHIDVVLVDKKQPEFVSKYNRTNRFIDVEFSCLDTTINLQTWVVLLDFLGMGAKVHDDPSNTEEQPGEGTQTQDSSAAQTQGDVKEEVNSEIKFRVESFTLILNKSEYELARATAANLNTQISLREGNISMTGQLGSLSLLDQSPHGVKYTQRFVSVGKQVMQFKFFKYGLPDFALAREFDMSLSLKMSSIRYVHTNRFQSELVAFCQHFLQLQDVLGRMRAASAGQKINDKATRGARIMLDVEADSPILLIPLSSRTDEVLIANLGRLRITNKFVVDGQPGTLRFEEATQSKGKADASKSQTRKVKPGARHVRDMTESVFEHSYPVMKGDPMTSSVYGSLDEDVRYDGLEVVSSILASDSDILFSPERGSSVDPSALAMSNKFISAQRGQSDSYVFSSSSCSTTSGQPTPSSSGNQDVSEEDVDGRVEYQCLLDVMKLKLWDMDLLSARRVARRDYQGGDLTSDMEFTTYIVQIEPGRLLHEKIELDLHLERNLEGDVSHGAPDWRAAGQLSSVHCHLDLEQYKLIRGILAHNLGEKVEEFQRPLMSNLQDPSIQTVLSGDVWKSVSLVFQLHNVSVELLAAHATPLQRERSLARLDFIRSRLSFESFSDQSKDIDLVSHEIVASDTRFKEEPVNVRPNVFTSILQPPVGTSHQGLQMEMHFRSAPDSTEFTVLLNNMRVMCIFDWLLSVQEFLMTEPENPFTGEAAPGIEKLQRQFPPHPARSNSRTQSPLTVSRGIVTKRGPLAEEVKVPFELRLNVSDTQFIMVENCTTLDTNAVILKSTAVLMYKPQASDKVLSCSLGSLEVFSCCLMAEEDTALSIIDPMTISIELNANPLPEPKRTAATAAMGLLAVPETQLRQLLLEISFNTMNIRVSYHDMMMFLAIINSLPGQALQATNRPGSTTSTATSGTVASGLQNLVATGSSPGSLHRREPGLDRLLEMGFGASDCRRALIECEQDLNLAALWLSVHASPAPASVSKGGGVAPKGTRGGDMEPQPLVKNENSFSVTAAELKASSVCLCLIDDCGDADVPLAEISCNGEIASYDSFHFVLRLVAVPTRASQYCSSSCKSVLFQLLLVSSVPTLATICIHQTLEPSIQGKANFQLVGEYYNRNLSGWEPFLEPWRCTAEWKQYPEPEAKLAVQIVAADVLNLNMTRTLMELYNQTKGSWTQDYLTQHREDQKKQKRDGSTDTLHRRSRFIPYVIQNDTGSPLWFMTATSTPTSLPGDRQPGPSSHVHDSSYIKGSGWERVAPRESRPFHFHRREKLRHKKTHDMHINQLVVMIDGWQKLSPVSVDKVGVYFRHAEADKKAAPSTPPARIVLDVQQEGSARKLIVVRSALVLLNKLDSSVELKLENTDEKGKHQAIHLPINQPTPIPLSCVHKRMLARPSDWQVHYCNRPLQWQHVTRPGEHSDGIRSCNALEGTGVYRFCVSVLRENYPEDTLQPPPPGHITPTVPGHLVTLLPPVTVINLLPLELHYYLRGTQVSGNLKPGHEAALHGVDLTSNLDLGIHLENFSLCRELMVPPNTHRYKVKLRVFDSNDRLLELIVRICTHRGGALR
ncbi:hypothetical protein BaRGS_00005444, partial [Batillaria attramentaria]